MKQADRVCGLLGCRYPVILAGMGGPSRAELVAAVSEAGGFGFLGMVREPPSLIAAEVEKLRRRGVERFGVNIIPAATAPDLLERQIETIIALEVPVVALFWDIDPAVVSRLRDAGLCVVYQVGSATEAVSARNAGAEIIVAQGREAGGHVRGTTPLRDLLPAVVSAVDVPVLAAGGLATGGDLVTVLALGGAGAVFGTALLATEESYAHPYHKQRLIAGEPGDTLLTELFHVNWPRGAPVRVLSNPVTEGVYGKEHSGIVVGREGERPIHLFSTDSPLVSMTGDFELMALYAGTGVGAVTAVRPAADVVREIVADAGLETPPASLEDAAPLPDLKALLAETLAQAGSDGPPFARDAEPIARRILRIAPLADGSHPR